MKGNLVQNTEKDALKYGHYGMILKLAAYIGPSSGLWNISDDVRLYLRGRDFRYFSNIWLRLVHKIIVIPSNQTLKNFDSELWQNLKFVQETRINVSRTILASWTRGLNLIRETYLYPFTSLPRVRSWYRFENMKFILVKEIITLIYYYSLVFSPSMLILT